MITSNAGAEFSTKTTINSRLAPATARKCWRLGASPRLPAPPDKTQLITQRVYESELLDSDQTIFGKPRKDRALLLESPQERISLRGFRSSNSRLQGTHLHICVFSQTRRYGFRELRVYVFDKVLIGRIIIDSIPDGGLHDGGAICVQG
jgi:hypothetical protein